MNRSKVLKYTLIYFLLLAGYVFLYVAKFEVILNPNMDMEPTSNVSFVYQQF